MLEKMRFGKTAHLRIIAVKKNCEQWRSLPGIDYSEAKSVKQTGGQLFPACLIRCTIVIASSRAGLPSFLQPALSLPKGSKESGNDLIHCEMFLPIDF
jgi:hypothetical protein